MTETSTETEHQEAAPEKPEQQPAEKTVPQSEVDRIVKERLARQKEQHFADYDDLKAKAQRLQEIEDANKSEQQKAADRIAELEKQLASQQQEVAKATLAALKSDVARAKGVPASRLHGITKEELEADADAYLAEVAAVRDAAKPTRKPPSSSGLKSGASSTGDTSANPQEMAAAAVRQLRQSGA